MVHNLGLPYDNNFPDFCDILDELFDNRCFLAIEAKIFQIIARSKKIINSPDEMFDISYDELCTDFSNICECKDILIAFCIMKVYDCYKEQLDEQIEYDKDSEPDYEDEENFYMKWYGVTADELE